MTEEANNNEQTPESAEEWTELEVDDQPVEESPEATEEPVEAEEVVGAEDADAPNAALQAERDELYERLQRVSADYQNYIRRSQQNKADDISLAKGDVVKTFIPMLDHLDQALSVDPEKVEAKSIYDGVKIVQDEFHRVLERVGVEILKPEPGEPFDPHKHEALMRQPAEGIKPNHISMTLQPGYVLNGRALRPANVAVAPAE